MNTAVDPETWKWVKELLDTVSHWVHTIIGISDDVASVRCNVQNLYHAIVSIRNWNDHFRDFFDHDTAHLVIVLDTLLSHFWDLWKKRDKRTHAERVSGYFCDSFDWPPEELYSRVMDAVWLFKQAGNIDVLTDAIIDYMIFKETSQDCPWDESLRNRVKNILGQPEWEIQDEQSQEEKIAGRVGWFFCDFERNGPDEAVSYHISRPAKNQDFREDICTQTLNYCEWPEEEPSTELKQKIIELGDSFISVEGIKHLRKHIQEDREKKHLEQERLQIYAYLWWTRHAIRAYDFWIANQHLEKWIVSVQEFLSEDARVMCQEAFRGSWKIHFDIQDQDMNLNIHTPTIWNLLLNMIRNASKHWKAQNISISTRKQGDMLTLEIADDGNWIENSITKEIFKEGWTSGEGSGLGLAQADHKLELMGWKIEVEGHGGKDNGALFRMILPIVTS